MRTYSTLILLPAMAHGAFRSFASKNAEDAANRPLMCNASTLAMPEWKGDTFRDCTNGLAAAVGAMTTSDTTATGLSDFCTKCGTAYDSRVSRDYCCPQATTWRTQCAKKEGWVRDSERKIKKYSTGLDGFGCTKTSTGDYCARLYANSLKKDFSVPDSCPFFQSCCFGLYNQWGELNTTAFTTVTTTCVGATEAAKLTKC